MGILTVKLLRCIWKTDTFIESLKAGDNVILMVGARAGGSHGKWWVCVCFQPAQGRTLGRRCGPSGGWIPDSVGTAQGLNGGSQDLSSLTRDRNPGPLQWTRRLLTTGPAGISHRYCQHIHCCQWTIYTILSMNNHWQENVGSHQKKKKRTPHVQGQQRSPSKMVGGAKLHLESNAIPTRDTWRAQTKPCAYQDSETPQRLTKTVFESPVEAQVSSGLLQGQGLWVQLPGPHSLWLKPSCRRSPISPP